MSRPDRLALAVSSGALALPETGLILEINARPSAFHALVDRGRLRCVQPDRAFHDALDHAGLTVTPRMEACAPPALAIVHAGRSRDETLGRVAEALEVLPPGARLAVGGAKTDGIETVLRRIARLIPLEDAFIKAHGRIGWLTRPDGALPEEIAVWRAAARSARNRAGMLTRPGFFSADDADPASRLLAETLAGSLRGDVADLGAGWGWLAHAALAENPGITALDLFESDARALDCARRNVTDPRAAFHWSDVTALAPRPPRHDAVIANPPFHPDRAADPALGIAFIAAAARCLKPSGRLTLVANRQLPYEAALGARFAQVERLRESRRFKVIAAARPRRSA